MREKRASASGGSRHPHAGEAGIHMQEEWGGGGHLHGNADAVREYSICMGMRALHGSTASA